MMVEPLADYVALLREALGNDALRSRAAARVVAQFSASNPLAGSHGDHVVRPSSMGRCSLELATAGLGLHDLPTAPEACLMMDEGTLLGAWLGALLVEALAAAPGELLGATEIAVKYRGVPGSIDLLVMSPGEAEVVEFKTTPSSAALRAPHEAKPSQCLQAATYALGVKAQRCSILTIGYAVGASRDGQPHPKMRLDTYAAADFRSAVDAEIDRMAMLAARKHADVLANAATLADTTDAWRCGYCRFSACPKNRNIARYAL